MSGCRVILVNPETWNLRESFRFSMGGPLTDESSSSTTSNPGISPRGEALNKDVMAAADARTAVRKAGDDMPSSCQVKASVNSNRGTGDVLLPSMSPIPKYIRNAFPRVTKETSV